MNEQDLLRAVKLGFAVGAPATFLVTAGIGLAAGATLGQSAVMGVFTGLSSGWYFGGIAFLHPTPRH